MGKALVKKMSHNFNTQYSFFNDPEIYLLEILYEFARMML